MTQKRSPGSQHLSKLQKSHEFSDFLQGLCSDSVCILYQKQSRYFTLVKIMGEKKKNSGPELFRGWFRFSGRLEHLSWTSWCCISSTCELGNQVAAVWSALLIILQHHIYSPKWNEMALEGRGFICIVIGIWQRTHHYKVSNWDYWKDYKCALGWC